MKSIQQMDAIIQETDSLLKEWPRAIESGNWEQMNIMRSNLRKKVDKYYGRDNLKGSNWHR